MYIFAVIIFAIKQQGDTMFKFLKLNSNECYVSKKEELKKAIDYYAKRDRRYGGVKEE